LDKSKNKSFYSSNLIFLFDFLEEDFLSILFGVGEFDDIRGGDFFGGDIFFKIEGEAEYFLFLFFGEGFDNFVKS